ncbi:uncharacterized protein P174DRAFT_509441 [Aspergillus novofumigatus IBT 16806]|uniref:Fungal specific transcription factor n=1 Tax=Aspergillus novofumigatus (strain IBT 16806) TaxID=1392255 RepID=A0A2I1CPI9_ASPN1|nr:uncharacterized protein P174DRAFT_509441 [Aspergillus novofumigatus IBT 16806]PKX99537.1 hypothetical protein P174DRAFT_509441 [Aspergillus novofumigatus IBT 16806]
MRFSSMLIPIISTFLLTIGRLLPINVDRFPIFRQRTVIDDQPDGSCPTNPPLSTTERTVFGIWGCVIYGYPSTGGVLRKDADLVDMLFLSLPALTEDWVEVQLDGREMTEEEAKVVEFGWPTDGVGVWVLRFASAEQLPRDFGRMRLAMNMEEKIQIMREYGATFVEDVTQVEELHDTF